MALKYLTGNYNNQTKISLSWNQSRGRVGDEDNDAGDIDENVIQPQTQYNFYYELLNLHPKFNKLRASHNPQNNTYGKREIAQALVDSENYHKSTNPINTVSKIYLSITNKENKESFINKILQSLPQQDTDNGYITPQQLVDFKVNLETQINIYSKILLNTENVLKEYRKTKKYNVENNQTDEEKLDDDKIKELAFKYYENKLDKDPENSKILGIDKRDFGYLFSALFVITGILLAMSIVTPVGLLNFSSSATDVFNLGFSGAGKDKFGVNVANIVIGGFFSAISIAGGIAGGVYSYRRFDKNSALNKQRNNAKRDLYQDTNSPAEVLKKIIGSEFNKNIEQATNTASKFIN